MADVRRSQWQDALAAFHDWFLEACDQVAEIESDAEPLPLSEAFGAGVYEVARWFHEKTSIDPTPIWRLYWALDQFHRPLLPGETRKEHTPGELAELLDGVDLIRQRLHWPGVALENRSRLTGQFQLEVDREARVIRRGQTLRPFGRKEEPWELFVALYDAGDAGCLAEDLLAHLWPGKPDRCAVDRIDKIKPILNRLLADLRIEADANGRVWRLAETREATG
jgi:hypothetical protein